MKKRYFISIGVVMLILIMVVANVIADPGTDGWDREIPYATKTPKASSCTGCPKVPAYHWEPLPPDSPILLRLRQADVAITTISRFGELDWDNAQRITYETKNDWEAIVVPIRNKAKLARFLLAGTADGGMTFHAFVMTLHFANVSAQANAPQLTGITYQTPDGALLIDAAIQPDGEIAVNTGEIQPLGLNWGCFVDCVLEMLGDFYDFCIPMCYYCAVAPSPYSPACWSCAACLGDSSFWCIIACWE